MLVVDKLRRLFIRKDPGAGDSEEDYKKVMEADAKVKYRNMSKFFQAIVANDVAKVRKLMGSHLSEVDDKGRTALHIAAWCGVTDALLCLLEVDQDLDPKDNWSLTPLVKAIERQKYDCARILLEHGASHEQGDNEGNTPLHYACLSGNYTFVGLLAVHKVDIQAKNKAGMTPLHVCGYYSRVGCAEMLIRLGVELNAMDSLGRTALSYAAEMNHFDAIGVLLKFYPDNRIPSANGLTPLDYASSPAHKDVKSLLQTYESLRQQEAADRGYDGIHAATAKSLIPQYEEMMKKKGRGIKTDPKETLLVGGRSESRYMTLRTGLMETVCNWNFMSSKLGMVMVSELYQEEEDRVQNGKSEERQKVCTDGEQIHEQTAKHSGGSVSPNSTPTGKAAGGGLQRPAAGDNGAAPRSGEANEDSSRDGSQEQARDTVVTSLRQFRGRQGEKVWAAPREEKLIARKDTRGKESTAPTADDSFEGGRKTRESQPPLKKISHIKLKPMVAGVSKLSNVEGFDPSDTPATHKKNLDRVKLSNAFQNKEVTWSLSENQSLPQKTTK